MFIIQKYRQGMIDFDAVPPTEDRRYIPIYSAQPKQTLHLVVIVSKLYAVDTHYVGSRTIPHTAEGCEGCKLRRAKRWKGYLGCWERQFSRLCLAEVTSEARMHCTMTDIATKDLRGMAVKLYRIGTARNAPGRVEFYEAPAGLVLPEPFDVPSALLRLWNGKSSDQAASG